MGKEKGKAHEKEMKIFANRLSLEASGYIGFRNSVSTASSFREVSAKRRPGGTLCFLFPSKGHTIYKKAIAKSRNLLLDSCIYQSPFARS